MRFIKKHWPIIVFTITGAIAGFLYWKFVGCTTGSCPIKSKWYLSTLYGGALGFLISSLFIKKKA
ncbi:MAG TPA: DUF6132 family protein [Bacteroidales bacterium]|jgi:hypothetical protein|nr:DUF6132 family protein [Bacteroidales bacterium]MDD4235140.1 DUF6132 family protein [Bacteroidales bacterium]HRW21604.1 DUF6132 family protein [Bacteroidales bacterium]HXK81578.1 DUF6132 family protein [Bacteroidales bacterium]